MSHEDKAFLSSWLHTCSSSTALLVLTPTGTGIQTWLLNEIQHTFHMDPVIISSHTGRIKTQIYDAYRSTITPLGLRKILVVLGYDTLVNDSTMMADALQTLQKPGIPTVCLAHVSRTVEKKFMAMFKAWQSVKKLHVMPKVEDIMQMLNVVAGEEKAKEISESCRGDVRQAMLQAEYTEFHCKDDFLEAHEVMDMVREGTLRTANDIYRAARGDPMVLSLALFEAYDPLECVQVADMYSFLDAVPHPHDDDDWHNYLTVTYPSIHFKERKNRKKDFSYGMVWSKSHLQSNRSKQAKIASIKMTTYGLQPMNQFIVDDCPIFRSMMCTFSLCKHENPPPWTLAVDSGTILKVMRLWKTPWYTHATTMRRLQSFKTNESNE